MAGLGVPELLIILGIVVVLFGRGKIASLGGEIGTAIREFRKGMNDGKETSQDDTVKRESLSDQTK